jgi:hypothetical protein
MGGYQEVHCGPRSGIAYCPVAAEALLLMLYKQRSLTVIVRTVHLTPVNTEALFDCHEVQSACRRPGEITEAYTKPHCLPSVYTSR